MEPITIALVVSVLFNLYCFKEIKALTKYLNAVTEENTILKISQDVKQTKNTSKLESLGFVNVYMQPNGRTRITALPKDKYSTKKYRAKDPINMLLGTSEVFISTPEK